MRVNQSDSHAARKDGHMNYDKIQHCTPLVAREAIKGPRPQFVRTDDYYYYSTVLTTILLLLLLLLLQSQYTCRSTAW